MLAAPVVLSDGIVSTAAILPPLQCVQIPITIKTDGKLKVDFGWMNVPSVGVKTYIPAFGDVAEPLSFVDSRPQLLSVLPADQNNIHFDSKTPFWQLTLTPKAVTSSDASLVFDSSVASMALPYPASAEGRKAAEEKIKADTELVTRRIQLLMQANRQNSTCPPPGDTELLVGDWAIGPNNEVVKFFVNAVHDLVNGPSDSNELVKAGYYIGSVTKALDPANVLGQSFMSEATKAAKNTFGENSVAYTAIGHINDEVSAVLDNPVKAAANLPHDVINSVATFGSQAVKAVQDAGIHLQVGDGKVAAGVGNTTIQTGTGPGLGVDGKVFGVHFHL